MATRMKQVKKLFKSAERKRQLILLIREHPDWSQTQIAKSLGVDRLTISQDIREITHDLQKMNAEAFQIHFQRMLLEIQANRQECMDRMRSVNDKMKGSRWMEEATKLIQLEMKLLGLDKMDPQLGVERATTDKVQRDAAIEAAIKGFEMGRTSGGLPEKMLVKHEHTLPERIPTHGEETEEQAQAEIEAQGKMLN